MGWQLSIKETKEETKYRIWTTISDGWITDWLNKEQIIKFLFWHRFEKFMESVLEDAMKFPAGFSNKDTGKYIRGDEKEVDEYHEFMTGRFKVDDENYMKVTADKFREIITKLGIEVKVNDSDGYNF